MNFTESRVTKAITRGGEGGASAFTIEGRYRVESSSSILAVIHVEAVDERPRGEIYLTAFFFSSPLSSSSSSSFSSSSLPLAETLASW